VSKRSREKHRTPKRARIAELERVGKAPGPDLHALDESERNGFRRGYLAGVGAVKPLAFKLSSLADTVTGSLNGFMADLQRLETASVSPRDRQNAALTPPRRRDTMALPTGRRRSHRRKDMTDNSELLARLDDVCKELASHSIGPNAENNSICHDAATAIRALEAKIGKMLVEANRRAEDAAARLEEERNIHKATSRQGNATADGLYAELDRERKAREESDVRYIERIERCWKMINARDSAADVAEAQLDAERESRETAYARWQEQLQRAEAAEAKLEKLRKLADAVLHEDSQEEHYTRNRKALRAELEGK